MSLLQLLTTGKSLVGTRDSENRYRMANRRVLPKFGSAKNPFRAVEPEGKGQAPNSNSETSTFKRPGESGGLFSRETAQTNAKNETAGSARPEPRPAERQASGREGWARRAMGRCREAAAALRAYWRWRLSSWAKPSGGGLVKAVPVFGKPPVQAELSLDRIRVVRNDLSDADLEVVRAKRPARAEAAIFAGNTQVAPSGSGRADMAEVGPSGR